MAKKALCIGINDYNKISDLTGCVNDAYRWAGMLKNHFDFAETDIELLTDKEATKSNMLTHIECLFSGAKAGDVLVYTFSGHGSYYYDPNPSDEQYDQVQCPHDSDNPLFDDELRERIANLPAGVRLTVISDSCHSGSVTRRHGNEELKPGLARRRRFLDPKQFRGMVLNELEFDELMDRLETAPNTLYPEAKMNEILLTGCNSKEYSLESTFGNATHGAFSHFACQVIAAANYRIRYRTLHKEIRKLLKQHNFTQSPQLEGSDSNKDRLIFT